MHWSDDAHEALRQSGKRAGAARSHVIAYLDGQTCCRGAQEIHADLVAAGRPVGLASVYRTLEMLEANGLVQRVDVGDGVVRFEPAHHDHHHHLVCDDCGKVEQFSDGELERAIEEVERRSGYALKAHDVLLRGSCAACRG
jgi:Fur family transcriptional regulator, ferric uptake regulator